MGLWSEIIVIHGNGALIVSTVEGEMGSALEWELGGLSREGGIEAGCSGYICQTEQGEGTIQMTVTVGVKRK